MAPKGTRFARLNKDGTRVQAPEPATPAVLPVRRKDVRLSEEDCVTMVMENFFSISECQRYLAVLGSEIDWKRQEVTLAQIPADRGGNTVVEPRMTLFMSDDGICYAYSGRDNMGVGWHPALLEIKERAERGLVECGLPPATFNSVQMNRYNGPRHSLGLHKDNEPDLARGMPIASVSFGAPRNFVIRHGTNAEEQHQVELSDGSFLVMAGAMQDKYLHGVPVGSSGLRFNLTFRVCVPRRRPPGGGPAAAPLGPNSRDRRAGDWDCAVCGEFNFERRLECCSCRAPQSSAPRAAASSRALPASPSGGPGVVIDQPYMAEAPGDDALDVKVDPHDGETCTLDELRRKYARTFSAAEISRYWRETCRPPSDSPTTATEWRTADVPRRVDPEDGARHSQEELLRKYRGKYSESEIRSYWRDQCKPA